MNTKKFIVTVFIIISIIPNSLADCIACWKLKNVNIVLKNKREVKGFLKWNEVWFTSIKTENIQFDSFFNKYTFTMIKSNKSELMVYKFIHKLEDYLPIAGLVTITDSVETISLSEIENIEIIDKQETMLLGAGEITDLKAKSINDLRTKPFSWIKKEGIVSETFFLNYNNKVSKDELLKIMETKDYWQKRKIYEDKGVIIITNSWD